MRIAVRTTVGFFSGIALIAASAHAARAETGALYRWETPDGTVAFTDDAKRVPERYRDAAENVDRSMLTEYGRYTPTDGAAQDAYAERLAKRLEALRAANVEDEAEVAEPEVRIATRAAAPVTRDIHRRRLYVRPDGTRYYRYSTDQTTPDVPGASLPVDPNDPNPVVTEKRRVRVPGQVITQTITVVRQGDRVLSVVKPRSHYHTIDFPELAEFEE